METISVIFVGYFVNKETTLQHQEDSMTYPTHPILKKTRDSYELYIHPADKERAKAIEGRRWDWNKKCWVFPNNTHFFNAIMAEFGDEVEQQIKGPIPPDNPPPVILRRIAKLEESRDLKKELQEIQETLKAIVDEDEESDSLKALLSSRDQELFAMRAEREKVHKELSMTRKWLAEKSSELERLSTQIDPQKADAKLDQSLFALAKEATGGDEKFDELLNTRAEADVKLAIDIANKMAWELRGMLEIIHSEDDLYTLINLAKEAELLSNEAIHLAHLIRVHRNIIVHGTAYHKTIKARIPMILFAAALLWPEFPE